MSGTVERVVLRGLTFQPDGSVALEFCIPNLDAYRNGVVFNHMLLVPFGADYDDEIMVVKEAVIALIDDVMEDVPNLETALPEQDDDDEDDDEDDDDDEDE